MLYLNRLFAQGLELTADTMDAVGGIREKIRAATGTVGRRRLRPTGRFVPPPPSLTVGEGEALDVWGFEDTKFEVAETGHVRLTGSRYDLCGEDLPSLLPWIQDVIQVEIDPTDVFESSYPPSIPKTRKNDAFLEAVKDILGPEQIETDAKSRLRHGHGHTQEEMFTIKHGRIDRIPDLVVYPVEEDEVASLVELAGKTDVCLIPYGGGTNVTDALRCPKNEKRMIVSVDMRRMNRILWIDPTNQLACIQAGAVGRHIQTQLSQFGFTMGHEPDSVEFSTLGGWIATHASGMKKNKYGNIEDIVMDVSVVTHSGLLSRTQVAPRESAGIDARKMVLGSEGNLGIITSAVVKLFPLPEAQRYGSVLFKTFEDGVSFLYDLTRSGTPPASVRLVDNLQFQFSMALKPAATGWRARKSQIEKLFVTKLKGFDPDKMVACTIVFEGTTEEVTAQEERVYRIAARHGGMKAGGANGERGYQLTFGIAYIRDFVMNHYVLGESFETSVAWSDVETLCRNVKERVYREHEARRLPGRPFVTCRVTQVYQTGVCVYFYLAYHFKGVENPSQVYSELEHAARDEILRSGGSVSHHHGIGKLRKGFLPRVMSKATLDWNKQLKSAVDPGNIFGAGNQDINRKR
ncbi:MAG: FAD-binding oxidoreductase [Myxococcota bacterium]|nr:FAD-binding oxidoreductase [Myxococcota bacterium]